MADSITKTGSFELFDIEPNWADDISLDYRISRRVVSYAGTPTVLEAIAPEVPVALSLDFVCEDKNSEFDLLTFFLSKKGQLNRFWLRHPASAFTLRTTALSGATGLYCKRNRFDLVYQGYERIYILMASTGDIIVRQITSCIDNADYTYIGFDTSIDRDVTLTNHVKIGRLLLGRWSTDRIKFSCHTSGVSEATLEFTELVKEYTLADEAL